jgi:hypothetical protein
MLTALILTAIAHAQPAPKADDQWMLQVIMYMGEHQVTRMMPATTRERCDQQAATVIELVGGTVEVWAGCVPAHEELAERVNQQGVEPRKD